MVAWNEHIHAQKDIIHDLSCYSPFASSQNDHLQELINNHENKVIAMLGGGEA